jgi:hypothetical protein
LGKKFPKSTLKEAFQNTELYKFFTTQVTHVVQLNQYVGDLHKAEGETTSKLDALNSQLQKLQKEHKEAIAQRDLHLKAKEALEQ